MPLNRRQRGTRDRVGGVGAQQVVQQQRAEVGLVEAGEVPGHLRAQVIVAVSPERLQDVRPSVLGQALQQSVA